MVEEYDQQKHWQAGTDRENEAKNNSGKPPYCEEIPRDEKSITIRS